MANAMHHIDADWLGWWLCERQLPSGGLNGKHCVHMRSAFRITKFVTQVALKSYQTCATPGGFCPP